MKCTTMTQCTLGRGTVRDTAWIHTKHAGVGKFLEVEGVDGWMVLAVFGTRPIDYVLDHERDYKKTRAATDI